MGLLDVLNGMQNGPRGPSAPGAQSDSGGIHAAGIGVGATGLIPSARIAARPSAS